MRLDRLFILLSVFVAGAYAQWLNHPDQRTPRTRDGKPNLSAPAPRLNGKPDLSGVWQTERTPMSEFARVMGKDVDKLQVDIQDGTKHMVNVFWDVKPEQVPLRDEAKSVLQHRMQNPQEFPQTQCLPLSVPMAMFVQVFKIVQAPQQMVILFEAGDPVRQIYTDGRSLPKDPQPSWMGYSAAKWEGDTLVVETAGFNSKGWIDFLGHPRSESMRITERYRRRDFGHMDLEMTFEDPKYYSQPFSIKTAVNLVPDSDVLDYVCTENEKDRIHLDTR